MTLASNLQERVRHKVGSSKSLGLCLSVCFMNFFLGDENCKG
jgi:hypothetical protein